MKKRTLLAILFVGSLVATFALMYKPASAPVVNHTKNTSHSPVLTQAPEKTNGFNKKQFSNEDPTSLWVIVNKKRPLPAGYITSDLIVPGVKLRLTKNDEQMQIRKVVEPDLISMFNAAKADNVSLVFGSGYRSEAYQRTLYTQYSAQSGQTAADKFSARPGYSEHQSGLSFDATAASGTCHLDICFETTPEGLWIKNHAHEYGFVIRYGKDQESKTGYQYEPWHLRYVGKELAAQIHTNGQTLEEFFGLPAPSQY